MEPVTLSNGHVYLLVDTSVQGGTIWTANKHPELNPTDLFYACLFMGVGGALALLFILYPVIIILSDKQMQQTFCYFLLSSCIANTSVVSIIMFYCVPCVIYLIGRPAEYAHVFKKQNVFKMIAAIWIAPLPLLLLLSTELFSCKYIYREQFTIFSYGLETCSDILEKFDLVFSVLIVGSTTAFDLVVAIGLAKRALRNKTNKTVEVELSFFIQTILTGIVYIISTTLYHTAGHTFISDEMWKVFFFDQFPKLCAILLIGIFCVTLQKRIREKFKEHFLIFCCLVLKDKEVEDFEFVLSRLETSVTSVATISERRNTISFQRNGQDQKSGEKTSTEKSLQKESKDAKDSKKTK